MREPNVIRPGSLWLRLAKTVWLGLWLGMATLLISLPIILFSPFSRTGKSIYHLARLWAIFICYVNRIKIRTHGRDQLDRQRSYVIIANHQSHYDSPALAIGLAGMQLCWIAKRELRNIPLFGHCLRVMHTIFIDRSDRESAITSIQQGLRQVPAGVSVICFAEGTRSADGRIGPFKKGGFAAAMENGLPLLPITINGSRRVLPKGSLVFNSGTIELSIGAPIETHDLAIDRLDDVIIQTRDSILSRFNPNAV
jgi:1-acyl-sn-glycerol-3-phosphate acyltransferase